MPTFWLALVLQILFVGIYNSWHVRIFYNVGPEHRAGVSCLVARPAAASRPAILTLLIISFALYSRYMRASMLDVINSDYVRTARAKGVRERKVIMRNVFRNALIPITTVAALKHRRSARWRDRDRDGLQPSTARATTSCWRSARATPIEVMAYLLVTAVIIIVFNLIADITYGFPRPAHPL